MSPKLIDSDDAFPGDHGSPMPHGGWRHVPAMLLALAFLLPLVNTVTGSLRPAGLPPPFAA